MTMGNIKFKRQNRSVSKHNLNSSMAIKDRDLGHINIMLDDKCLSCSGNNGIITQAFKLACIN